jgi:hypothetical protein
MFRYRALCVIESDDAILASHSCGWEIRQTNLVDSMWARTWFGRGFTCLGGFNRLALTQSSSSGLAPRTTYHRVFTRSRLEISLS